MRKSAMHLFVVRQVASESLGCPLGGVLLVLQQIALGVLCMKQHT
jgi:hypothetical protein